MSMNYIFNKYQSDVNSKCMACYHKLSDVQHEIVSGSNQNLLYLLVLFGDSTGDLVGCCKCGTLFTSTTLVVV